MSRKKRPFALAEQHFLLNADPIFPTIALWAEMLFWPLESNTIQMERRWRVRE